MLNGVIVKLLIWIETMSKLARNGDSISGHDACGGVTIVTSSGNVGAAGSGAARMGDMGSVHGCKRHSAHPPVIASGSSTISINGKPAARVGDPCNCGSSVVGGAGTVSAG